MHTDHVVIKKSKGKCIFSEVILGILYKYSVPFQKVKS